MSIICPMSTAVFYQPAHNPLTPRFWLGEVSARPLGLFRIAFGLVLCKDAFYRLLTARLFYSESGLAPMSALRQGLLRAERFSLMDATPSAGMATVFLAVWLAVSVGLTLGWQTRWMSALNFVLILSVHERNPFVLTGADSVLRVLSFWALFLPLGRAYSLDARALPPASEHTFALPLRLIQLQIVLVYLFTFLLKLPGVPWREGTALYYALQLRSLTLPTGDFLLAHAPPVLLSALTYYTLLVEGGFLFFVYLPFYQPFLRGLGVILVALLHLGIAVMMSIPNFSLVMCVSYLLFLPAPVAPLAGRRWPRRLGRLALAGLLLPLMGGVVWWNLAGLERDEKPFVPPPSGVMRGLVHYTGLWQFWGMFSPYPTPFDGWFRLEGQFQDGTRLDLLTGRPPSEAQTRWFWGPEERYKKYIENVQRLRPAPLLGAWGAYSCREAAARPEGSRLMTVEIWWVYRRVHPPGGARRPLEYERLWLHWCEERFRPSALSSGG